MQKRYFITSFIILSLVVLITTFFAFAYFFEQIDFEDEQTVGSLNVEIKPYFLNDNDLKEYVNLQVLNGIVNIDITNVNGPTHFNRFGVDIEITSNIDVYFRVAVFEQFAMTYDTGDKQTVVATTREEFAPLAYSDTFFDNRLVDEYYYYKTKVNGENITINFIEPTSEPYPIYDQRYQIMMAFVVETVQAYLGPVENWDLETPPWNSQLEW